jgi:hypothetical protein
MLLEFTIADGIPHWDDRLKLFMACHTFNYQVKSTLEVDRMIKYQVCTITRDEAVLILAFVFRTFATVSAYIFDKEYVPTVPPQPELFSVSSGSQSANGSGF